MLPASNELITFVPHATQDELSTPSAKNNPAIFATHSTTVELSTLPTANNPIRVSLSAGQG